MAYPAASDAVYYIGETPDTDGNVQITNCLKWAIQVVETTTGRVFDAVASDGTEKRYFNAEYDVDDEGVLWLDKDLLSVSLDTDGKPVIDAGTTDIILSTSDIVYLPANGTPKWGIKILASSGKYWSYEYDADNAISVTGVWGYSSTPPEDINWAILRLTKWMFNQRITANAIDQPLLTGDGVTIMPMRLPADVLTVLAQYKKPKYGAV